MYITCMIYPVLPTVTSFLPYPSYSLSHHLQSAFQSHDGTFGKYNPPLPCLLLSQKKALKTFRTRAAIQHKGQSMCPVPWL